ncbi:MAG TPA: MYXO-CTERM sorting domain-containing protein, partial [Myxococcota bacterium]|nr:MYXO-CTERM sorting domain-containing protein [Myxococcota bacterium]
RLGTGEACVADGQCTTYRCGVFASGWFCTQHCVDDWCPEGLVCVDHELGRVCAPPSPGTPDEPAGMQDAAVTDDTGAPPGPLPIRDDGCAATGGRSDPGALLLLGLVLAAWFRGARRRAA